MANFVALDEATVAFAVGEPDLTPYLAQTSHHSRESAKHLITVILSIDPLFNAFTQYALPSASEAPEPTKVETPEPSKVEAPAKPKNSTKKTTKTETVTPSTSEAPTPTKVEAPAKPKSTKKKTTEVETPKSKESKEEINNNTDNSAEQGSTDTNKSIETNVDTLSKYSHMAAETQKKIDEYNKVINNPEASAVEKNKAKLGLAKANKILAQVKKKMNHEAFAEAIALIAKTNISEELFTQIISELHITPQALNAEGKKLTAAADQAADEGSNELNATGRISPITINKMEKTNSRAVAFNKKFGERLAKSTIK